MIYFCLLIVIIAIIFGGLSIKLKSNSILFVIFVLLSLFCGLRYNVGVDYDAYLLIFDDIKSGNDISVQEPGYRLLVEAIIAIGGNQQLVFLLFAFATNLLIYKYIKYNSPNSPFLSLFTYLCVGAFFLSSLNLVRQYLAIAIFAYSLKYVMNKKFYKYLIIILLGAFFAHTTLLLLLPVYLLNNKISNKSKLVIILSLFLLSRFVAVIIQASSYSVYLLASDVDNSMELIYLFFIITFLLLLVDCFDKCNCKHLFFNLNFMSFLFLMTMILNPNITTDIFMRMNNYFFIGAIVLIPSVLSLFKQLRARLLLSTFYFLFLFVYYFRNTLLNGFDSKLLPYNINLYLFDIF